MCVSHSHRIVNTSPAQRSNPFTFSLRCYIRLWCQFWSYCASIKYQDTNDNLGIFSILMYLFCNLQWALSCILTMQCSDWAQRHHLTSFVILTQAYQRRATLQLKSYSSDECFAWITEQYIPLKNFNPLLTFIWDSFTVPKMTTLFQEAPSTWWAELMGHLLLEEDRCVVHNAEHLLSGLVHNSAHCICYSATAALFLVQVKFLQAPFLMDCFWEVFSLPLAVC